MSLARLMPHFMLIQSCEDSVQSSEGFIDRAGTWKTEFLNIRCNIQERVKKVIDYNYAKQQEMNHVLIYYISREVYNKIQDLECAVRVLVWREDFAKQLTSLDLELLKDNSNKSLFNIYLFQGNHNVTEGGVFTSKKVYVLTCLKDHKMNL